MAQAQAQMAGHGAAWLASQQTIGKGQRGKSWQSEPGQNIALSTIISPHSLSVARQFEVSVMVAMGCHDFLVAYTACDVRIKWPNDLYWKDRKAGGILIENLIQGNDWKYAVAGIGINVNQVTFDSLLPNPVSLKQITGKTYNVPALAKHLCQCLETRWQQLHKTTFDHRLDEYNTRLYKLGETVRLKMENAVIEATVLGVNKNGELLIKANDVLAIPFGTVEWLPG